jgi:hypothetical protein
LGYLFFMSMLMKGHGSGGGHADDALDDNLDADERDRLDAAIAEADAEIDRGEGIPGDVFFAELHARRPL